MYIYHTGIAIETDKHYGVLIFPRSSNRNTDAYLCNHVGVADTAIYRGEIILCYKNRTSLEVRAEIERMKSFMKNISNSPLIISTGDGLEFTLRQTANNSFSSWVYDNPMIFAPYKVGDRVGQMVVIPYPNVRINRVKELSETERSDGAFGSTGN